jgi:CubicO group peptidase (beta-lactamase class C family)
MKHLVAVAVVAVAWCALAGPIDARSSATAWSSPEGRVEAIRARIEARQSPDRQGLDPFTLDEIMKRFHVPGVSVAVIRDFQVHWSRGYGVADATTGDPVTAATLFQAASISKPVTAVAVMRLVQQGRLDLDADVNGYLKSWKVPESEFTRVRPVTLRSLLSHTSGTGDGFGFPGYHPSAPRPSVPEILAGSPPSNVGPVFWERPPLTAQKYSGGGTLIVQLVLTDVLGRAFPDLMRELVLEPFGMRDSAYEQPLSPERDRAAARAHDGGGAARDAKWHVYPELAAAGLWTTPADLGRLAIEVQKALQGRSGFLTRAAALELVSPVGTGPFAIGFSIERRGEGWYFMHGGSNWGFQCDLLAHRLKGYGVAVMANADSARPVLEEIEARVASAYGWDSLDKPVRR